MQTTDLFAFNESGKKTIKRVVYKEGKCLEPEKVAEKAKRLLQNPKQMGEFDVVTNNCEHFATLCKTGEPKSVQTEKLKEMLNAVQTTVKSVKSCYLPCCWLGSVFYASKSVEII